MEILIGLCVLVGTAVTFGLVLLALVLIGMRMLRSSGVKSPFGAQGLRVWVDRGNLLASGTAGRAILLSVAGTGTRTTFYGQRCEIRRAWLDLEMPGFPPFELQADLYIPTNMVRDALPGTTMEIRIDPQNQAKVLIVGPDVGYTQGAVRAS